VLPLLVGEAAMAVKEHGAGGGGGGGGGGGRATRQGEV
jgi:hypothetical protein